MNELAAEQAAALAMREDDAGYDIAVCRLLAAEAVAGAASTSRSTVPNVQFARRIVTAAMPSRLSPGVPDDGGDDDRRHRRHHRERDRDRRDRHSDRDTRDRDGDDRRHSDRDRRHDRDRDRDRDRNRDRDRDRDRDRRHDRDRQREAAASESKVTETPAGKDAKQQQHTSAADASPSSSSWVRKGMRVRLIAAQGAEPSAVRTAVVSAARDPEAVTLRHDGTGAVLTAREAELLPAAPRAGGSAIVLSGEHAGHVGHVFAVSVAQRQATVQLADGGAHELHLLDVCDWAPGDALSRLSHGLSPFDDAPPRGGGTVSAVGRQPRSLPQLPEPISSALDAAMGAW